MTGYTLQEVSAAAPLDGLHRRRPDLCQTQPRQVDGGGVLGLRHRRSGADSGWTTESTPVADGRLYIEGPADAMGKRIAPFPRLHAQGHQDQRAHRRGQRSAGRFRAVRRERGGGDGISVPIDTGSGPQRGPPSA